MGNVLYLTSPIPVSVNHYLATRIINKNGKPMAIVYETNEAKAYKKWFASYIKEEIQKQNWNIELNSAQHFYCDCVFYFDRIDKDCNNYFKLLLDAITETQMIWVDDNVVCERVNRIYYDSENPRIELNIYPVEYIGIFDNKNELEQFENNCQTCKRYKRNCSILKKSKEGRIQNEVTVDVWDGICCSKYSEIK